MLKFSWTDLGTVPVKGPFSHYLNGYETAILVALVNSVKPRVMIEFGCNMGVTAARLLENVPSLERYIGIDVPSDHVPTLACQASEIPLNAGCCVDHDVRFYLLVLPSLELVADSLERCDAVFIDGDHSEAAVIHESRLARALVRPGGIICWHDYTNPAVEVTQAIDRLRGEGWPINCVENSWLAFLRVEDHYADETA